MRLENAATAPLACEAEVAGYVYFDTTLSRFMGCNGSAWVPAQHLPTESLGWEQLTGVPDELADGTDAVGIDGVGVAGKLAVFGGEKVLQSSVVTEKDGNLDVAGGLITGETYLARYALALYIHPSHVAKVGAGLGGNYGLLPCFPTTSDNEPSTADEQILGYAFDIGGSGSPSSCMAGAPDLGNHPCVRLDIGNTARNSHDAYGVICHSSANGGLAYFGYDFDADKYLGSGNLSDSGIAELPTEIGQIACTKNGYACVQRIR